MSTSKKPKLSVIVPIYNVEKYLTKCLQSLTRQTLKPEDYEIILINDSSPDESFTIAKNFARTYKNIILLENNKNLGLGRTRNKGIKKAKGDYIFFLDSDDYLDPIALETMLIKAKEQDADIVTTGYIRVDEDNKILATNNAYYKLGSNKIEILKKILEHEIPNMSCARLIKRDLFIKNNIWFPEGLHEDVPVVYKLFIYAKKTCGTKNSFYFWVTHKGSITSHVTEQHINGLIDALQSKAIYIKNNCEKGFFLKLYPSLEIGWCKVFQSKLKQIAKETSYSDKEKIIIYKYIFTKLKNNKEFKSALKKNKSDFLFLYIFFDSFEKYPFSKAKKIFEFYIEDKDRLILFTHKGIFSYLLYFIKKYLKPFYKLLSLFKKAITQKGNTFSKMNYLERRILKSLERILDKKYFQRIFQKLSTKTNKDLYFFCTDITSIKFALNIIKEISDAYKISIILTDSKLKKLVPRNINRHIYQDSFLEKINIKSLKEVIYFTDEKEDFIRDIREFRRRDVKTVGIIIDNQNFKTIIKTQNSNLELSPFRIFEYLIVDQDLKQDFIKDEFPIVLYYKNSKNKFITIKENLVKIYNRPS